MALKYVYLFLFILTLAAIAATQTFIYHIPT